MNPKAFVFSMVCVGWLAVAYSSPVFAQTLTCEVGDSRQLGGAYRMADGQVVSVLPSGTQGRWRITNFGSGKSHHLQPTGALTFQSANDVDSENPVALRYQFSLGKNGLADALTVQQNSQRPWAARKLKLREETAVFDSAGTTLFGKLTLPATGQPPFKTVLFVHGSDPVPSVGQEWLPHLLAANGIATLVFDKRGTGCSKGQYLQHFGVLSDDVVAAVGWLKTKAEVDQAHIGLAGFSQGGWVAPLAALKEPAIKFVVVGYGLAMSMADEDRLEAPLKLKAIGVDAAAIAEYQELNSALHQLARAGFKDWRELEGKLDTFKDRAWLATAKGLPTWLGLTLQMGLTQAKVVAPPMFENFFQPFYEPVPTLEKLNIPMLWLIAEQDIEAPPEPTIAALKRLRQQGKPFATVIFPESDHGMFEFEMRDGKRVKTKYADKYFATVLKWIKDQKANP
jgi:uncharacterized protein